MLMTPFVHQWHCQSARPKLSNMKPMTVCTCVFRKEPVCVILSTVNMCQEPMNQNGFAILVQEPGLVLVLSHRCIKFWMSDCSGRMPLSDSLITITGLVRLREGGGRWGRGSREPAYWSTKHSPMTGQTTLFISRFASETFCLFCVLSQQQNE